MHSRTALTLCLLLSAGGARAEQGTLQFTPRLAADNSLTVELRNLSKLPIKLTGADLKFAAATVGAVPCAMSLPGAVSIGPAETKTVSLGAARDMGRCMPAPAGPTGSRRLSVLTAREFAQPELRSARPAGGNLHPADLEYTLQIGDRTLTDTTTWHFVAE